MLEAVVAATATLPSRCGTVDASEARWIGSLALWPDEVVAATDGTEDHNHNANDQLANPTEKECA